MQLKVKVKVLLPLSSGVGANGKEWQRQDFVGNYVSGKDKEGKQIQKQIVFQGFGNVVNTIKEMQEGDLVEVFYNPEAKEHQGKWYGTNSVWKIEKI